MSIFAHNMAIVSLRWPDISHQITAADITSVSVQLVEDEQLTMLYDDIQIASSFDQVSEAKIQIKHIPSKSSQVFLYGTGLGGIQKELLLNDDIQQLNVVIMNISVFKASLTHFEQIHWLEDIRVNLILGSTLSRVFFPFIALPAELTLSDNATARLRDIVSLELDDAFIEKKKGKRNQERLDKISTNLVHIQKDKDVKSLFKNEDKRKFIVCGAGPTLENHFTWLTSLPNRSDFFIIAADASVMPLATVGVIPDVVVSVDPVAKRLFTTLNMDDYINTALVYFPVIDASFLKSWKGKRYVSYSSSSLYDDINTEIPRGRLYSGGSVIHPAIDLSVKMGAKNIFLLGGDFSFPEGKTHAVWQENYSSTNTHLLAKNTPHWVLNSKNQRVPTLLNFRGYLRDLEKYIALTKGVNFYNTSDKGASIKGTKLWKIEDGFYCT